DYITSGWDTYQGKRISALTSAGATISIPEQSTAVHGPYWQVIPTATNDVGRLEKREIDNVNIAGHKFNLQISSGGKTAIITVNIKKAAHYVPEMTGFRLYDAKNDAWYEGVQTSYRGDHFVVTLPANLGTKVPVASRIRGEGRNMHLGVSPSNANRVFLTDGSENNDAKWTIDFSGLTSEQDFIKAVADVRGATAAEIEIEAIYNSSKLKLFVDKNNNDTLDSGEEVGYVDFGSSNTDAANLPVKTLDASAKTLGTVKVTGSGKVKNYTSPGAHASIPTSPAVTGTTGGAWTYFVSGGTGENWKGGSATATLKANVSDYTTATPTGLTYSCSIGYTYDNVDLGAWLEGLRVYAEIGNGTYATPGGKGFGVTTNAFGMNGDANGNGRKDSFEYAEIENHITTVKDIWTGNYTVD
ncbi:hypothetical protein, partial [Acutalibacter intestini]|uniref:hypothetical protein n=1 Tax=Acutalibacter intestini TaxID=3093659 RepID=UPI002AC95B6A